MQDRVLDIHIHSADGCTGVFSVRVGADGALKSGPIEWSPTEPVRETEDVMFIRVTDGVVDGQLFVSGDNWREVEERSLEEELFSAVCNGADILESFRELVWDRPRPGH